MSVQEIEATPVEKPAQGGPSAKRVKRRHESRPQADLLVLVQTAAVAQHLPALGGIAEALDLDFESQPVFGI